MYSYEQINELKSKIDYYEFYSKYLKDLPNNKQKVFVCCCFHNEVKPSMQIDLKYGLWHCWGACNTGGDIFSFYQKFFNVTFTEAVEQIADMYNYELIVSEEVKKERDTRKQLYNINKLMCEKYQTSLHSNNEAYNYLFQIRGFSPKIIEDFKLGCGINKLPDKESLKRLGLLVKGDNEEYYSKFRNDRVIFPKFDEHGNIISFTGRLYKDKDGAKYMHTSDTEIYRKSEHVYGLYQAKKYIKHFNSVICVEGEIDMVKCHQKGISNTVCISGLNMSNTQINLLKKYTNNFYICVEDSAILKPNDNFITPLDKIHDKIKENIPYAKVYVVDLREKDGEKCDPDMFLTKYTREDFMEKVKHARIYNEFIINSKISNINPKNIEEKNACISMIIPNLARISNFLDRKQYIELVSNKLLYPETDIYKKIKFFEQKQNKLNTSNITWDSKPVYAQKILISTCFCNIFDTNEVIIAIKCSEALEKMEEYYKNIFLNYILPYVGSKEQQSLPKVDYTEFFNNITNNKDISDEIKETIMDCYFKSESLEEFEPDDYRNLIQEQIDTLDEYIYTDVGVSVLDT